MEKIQEEIRTLRGESYDIKQKFYGQMCDHEIQQAFIRDIEWIKKTKDMVMQRHERQS